MLSFQGYHAPLGGIVLLPMASDDDDMWVHIGVRWLWRIVFENKVRSGQVRCDLQSRSITGWVGPQYQQNVAAVGIVAGIVTIHGICMNRNRTVMTKIMNDKNDMLPCTRLKPVALMQAQGSSSVFEPAMVISQ